MTTGATHEADDRRTAPKLFDGQPPVEILVPALAHFHYERAVSIGARLADTWGLPLRLVHVHLAPEPTSATALGVAVSGVKATYPEIVIDAVEVEADDVASGVENAAADRSLIVLGSEAGSQWGERGSIGETLVQRASTMLMMCGPACSDDPPGASVVVPLDGSERAEAAIEPAIAVADASNARLWLVTAVSPSTVETVAKQRDEGEPVSESGYLRSVVERLSERGVDAGWEVVHHGDPVAGINGLARNLAPALIVAATHGRTGAAKRAFGSICMGLVERGPAPVLVVKTEVADPIPLAAPDATTADAGGR